MPHPLIDPVTLERSRNAVRLFDIRWRLSDPGHGRAAYCAGHIPTAVFVDLDSDLSGSSGSTGRHPLPDPVVFQATLGRLGVGPDDPVVVYDDAGGTTAARMWWMLQAIGHDSIRVLDGGLDAWLAAGFPLETREASPDPVAYPGPISFSGVVDIDALDGRLVVDVRSPERYRGDVEPVDPRPGHIPGAVNIPTSYSLVDGRFADRAALGELYGNLDEPVVSCGSGVTACHTALAMAAAGLDVPEVYVGSYSEWSRSSRPVATGAHPR